MSVLYTNTSRAIPVTLTQDGDVYPVDPGSTVMAALVSETAVVSAVVTCASGTDGADWPNGVVVVLLSATDTAGMPELAAAVEIKITDGGGNVSRWQTPNRIQIRKGLIP